MRTVKLALALITGIGWAVSAQGGTISQSYSVQDQPSSTWKTLTVGPFGSAYTYSPHTISGTLMAGFTTPNSTFAKSDIPSASVWLHLGAGKIAAKGSLMRLKATLQRTVAAWPNASASCHVGASGKIAASCSATFSVTTKVHCTGQHKLFSGSGCTGGPVFGCFTGASDMHTNLWTGKVHLGAASFTHTAESAHYLKSFEARLVPPKGHTCNSNTPTHLTNSASAGHLASSNLGYHTSHIVGKLLSTQ